MSLVVSVALPVLSVSAVPESEPTAKLIVFDAIAAPSRVSTTLKRVGSLY